MNAPSKRPPLQGAWVDRIFDRMQGMYGSLWVDRWRSGEIVEQGGREFDRGLMLAKVTWAEELAGFADQPERLSQALAACRSLRLPPTLPEFLALCRQQIPDAKPSLPAPALTEAERRARSAQIRAGAASLVNGIRVPHPKAWAHGLREDYLKGAKLKPIQIELASGALGEVWERGVCRRANEEAEA